MREEPEIKYHWLLLVFLCMFLVIPALSDTSLSRHIFDILFAGVIILSCRSVLKRRAVVAGVLAAGVLSIALRWIGLSSGQLWLLQVGLVCGLGFSAFAAIVFFRNIMTIKFVTFNTIYGAICVYIFIGLLWAFCHSVVFEIDPSAYKLPVEMAKNPVEPGQMGIFFYYSFVTLTTLGYGDITPLSEFARSLSVLEAIAGQMYLAILVARLMGLHLQNSSKA